MLHNVFFWEIWPPKISVTKVHAPTLLRYYVTEAGGVRVPIMLDLSSP